MARINPTGLQRLHDRLSPLALAGARAGAEVLRDKLSGEGHGRHYAGLPRRSSAETEYPAEQSSALRDSIDARPREPAWAEFGPIDAPPDYVTALHGKSPADGGRPFMDDAVNDRDVRDAIRREMGAK